MSRDFLVQDSVYLGIDPGASGGLAWIRRRQHLLSYCAIRMPDTLDFVWAWFKMVAFNRCGIPIYACIEKVGGYIGEKDNTANPAPGSAMFNFGVSYGSLLMALTASGVPYTEVHATTWQSALQVMGKGGRLGHKRWLKGKAECLFPNVKVTLYNCDALLLAHYCRLQVESARNVL